MEINAIGFDYGGVIDDIPGPLFKRNVANILDVDPISFQDVYSRIVPLLNNNILGFEGFWEKIVEELKSPDKYGELMAYLKNLPPHQINNQLIDLSDRLRSNGYKTGILSNNTIETINVFKTLGLFDHFDVITVSAEIGYSKPEPEAYKIFAEKLGVKVTELAFVDDTEKSLSSAKGVGFYPIIFNDYASLIDKLMCLGIKI
jgi:HAD superfamily hydrolase (TIGR01509 family)